MKSEITKRQKEVLLTIYNSLRDAGFPPTFEEMREKLDVTSNQTVIDLLGTLTKKNFITREEGSARGIVITALGYETLSREPLVKISGITAAGPMIQMIQQNEWIQMPSGHQKYDDVFIVRVSGSSMIEAGIYDGDMVLIKKAEEFKSGDIVLARQGDAVTLKRFMYDKGRTYLKPENPACRIIPITHDTYFLGKMLTILGK